MIYRSKLLTSGFVAFALLYSTQTYSHGSATGIVKERMDIMVTVGDTLKMLSGMAKGSIPFNAKRAAQATRQISDDLGKYPTMFTKHSGAAPSEAAPEIWTDTAGFKELAKKLEAASLSASKTLAASSDQSEIKAILIELGNTCKACHKKYRIKR